MSDCCAETENHLVRSLLKVTSSYEVWQWSMRTGGVGQPNRKTHERHLRKLDRFLQKVSEQPWIFSTELQLARDPSSDVEIQVQF
eukprot:symbB.v1.2.029821.t2/scaffold3305.1/size59406/2